MKNILTFLLVSIFALTRSAAQVTWTGAPTGGVWTTAANWSGGSVPTATDSIVLSTSATDTLLISDLPATISLVKLRIGGTTKVKFWGLTTSTVITVTGGAGTDVVIDSLASLTLASSSVIGGAGSIAINLAMDATAEITGKLHFTTNTNSSANAHRLQGLIANAITFKNSAVFTMGPGASGNPFGAGTGASAANSVLFDNGSAFIFNGGSNPFGLTAPASVTIFNPNSTFKINTSGNSFTPALSGRTYGNVEVINATYAGTSTGAGAFTVTGNLMASVGAITLNLSGGVNIKGNITVAPNATLAFGAGVLVTLNGTTEQVITNNGRLTLTDATTILKLNNAAGARLGSSLSTRTFTLTNGCLTLDNFDLGVSHFVNGGSVLSHIVTNGTGVLKRDSIGTAAANFPVGVSKLSYDPVWLTNSGTADTFAVRVDTILTNPPATATNRNNILKREWNISENVAGGSNLMAVFSIDPSGLNLNNTTFTPATVIVGQYNNSWNSLPATLSGTDVTATGLTTVSAFAIANTGAFTVAAVGGTIATPTTTICAGQAIQFNLTGAVGDTLQWQSSADSSVWANVGTVGALTLSVIPSATTFYRVKATGAGTAYSNAMKIVVNPKPVPNFTSNVALGTATFTNTSSGGNSYAWRFGNAANSTSSAMSPTFTYTAIGSYSVQLIVTSAAGCVDSIAKTVVISGLQAAAGGTVATATTHICIGTAAQLTLTGAAGDTLQWQSSLDSSVWANTGTVGVLTLNVTPSVTTYYRVKASGVGTAYSNGIKIVVNPKPVPNFTSSVAGAIATFTNTSTGANSYTWRFGNAANSTSSAMSPTFTYATNGNYSVQLIVISAAGCVDSITKTVVISGLVAATGGAIATATTNICIGTATQLTLTGAAGDTLQWQSSLDSSVWANTGTVGALTLSVNPSVTTFYRVKATGVGTAYSNGIKIVVNPKPVPNFTSSVTGATATFTNTSTGASTYAWRFGNAANSTSTTMSPTFAYAANGTYSVKLIVTSTAGCVDSISKPVVITGVATGGTMTTSTTNICVGQAAQLTLTGAIGDTLQWQSSADSSVWSNTGTVGALTLSVTPSVTTFYRVKASGAGTTYSNVLKVVVNPKPVPNFTFTTVGGAVTFTNASTGASTYTWRFGNPTNSTSTSASPTFTYTANGNYTVQIIATSAAGCVDSTSKVVAITRVGINETKYGYGLNIYPNPTQEVLNIDLKSTPLMNDELLVLDGLGKIKSVQLLTQLVQLTTTQWSAGIYFIAIRRDGNLQIVEKVIKN
jgi:PKD repeat protein